MKKYLIIFLLLIPCASWAASSRVLPASYTEYTYDSAGGGEDYTALATWEADTDTDLVTAKSGHVLTCSSGIHNDTVILEGATTNASYFRVIRAASGARGTPTSGVRFEVAVSVSTAVLNIQESNFQVHDIAGKVTSTTVYVGAFAFIVYTPTGAITARIAGCTGYGITSNATGGYASGVYAVVPGSSVVNIFNCAFKSISGNLTDVTGGIVLFNSTGLGTATVNIFNNTINTSNKNGISLITVAGSASTAIVKNTIIQSCSTDMYSSGAGTETYTQTTNATSGITFAADGYHLDSTDTGAIGDGTDLSATFTDDIDGETRPTGANTWDIGADEYFAPAGGRRRIIMVQ